MAAIKLESVREYCEEMTPQLDLKDNRWVVVCFNEAGYNRTELDLVDLLKWLKENKPELLRVD